MNWLKYMNLFIYTGVIEFVREATSSPFAEEDVEVAIMFHGNSISVMLIYPSENFSKMCGNLNSKGFKQKSPLWSMCSVNFFTAVPFYKHRFCYVNHHNIGVTFRSF